MVSTRVYFATNRLPGAAVPGGYGDGISTDPGAVDYATITVTGTDITDAASGQLGPVVAPQKGSFPQATRDEIINSGKNLLVFIHGFANSFEDAMKRAAFNRAWFADSDRAGADTTVIAYTWPSPGKVVSNPLDPDAQYKTDRDKANRSGPCIAAFLRQVLGIAAEMKQKFGDARVFLLAHSMGNHALNGAVVPFMAAGAAPVPFDDVVLAAADEFDTALETPDHSGLYRLRDMARRITIYSSHRDAILGLLSFPINQHRPLGLDGAKSEADTGLYPPQSVRSVDCTMVFDLLAADHSLAPDATHQYYRRSRCVRADIALLMADGPVKPGLSSLAAPPL